MWIDLPNFWIVVLNCLGIPAAHLIVAWWSTRLPADAFLPSGFLFRTRAWEHDGNFYQRVFLVRRWKDHLPDAAPWFRGFAKDRLRSSDRGYLQTFMIETCRGEFSHWIQIIAINLCLLWTPNPACLIIVAYSLLSNLPCIINLRHVRARLQGVLRGQSRAGSHSP